MAITEFSSNEQHIIRAFLVQEGRVPTQTEMDNAFEGSSGASALNRSGVEIPTTQEVTNTDFAASLYDSIGREEPTQDEVNYWAQEAQASRAQALLNFQYAAREEIASSFETELSDLSGLESQYSNWAEPEDGDEGGDEPAPEITTDYVFSTDAANPYNEDGAGKDDIESGVTRDPATGDEFDIKDVQAQESSSHAIFNIGKDAIETNTRATTSDYTFSVTNQLGEDGEYEAYFLSPMFEPAGGTPDGSKVTINIYDQFATAENVEATLENARTDVISFRLNGDKYAIVRNEAQASIRDEDTTVAVVEALGEASNYQETLAAIQSGLEAFDIGVSAELTDSLGRTEQRDPNNDPTGDDVLYNPIELTANAGELTAPEASGTTPGNSDGNGYNAFYASQEITGESGVISTNLELENVGYGSMGGSVNIASQSGSNKGVEVFNVSANQGAYDLGVAVGDLSSVPLRADKVDVNGTDMENNLLEVVNLTGGASYFTVESLTDVREFNGSSFNQNTTVGNAAITSAVIDRDLDLGDTDDNPADDTQTFDYNFGSGDDTLNLQMTGDEATTNANEVATREDVELDISMGAGDNTVTVQANQSIETGAQLENLSVTTGGGQDNVEVYGTGRFDIDTNNGDDTVYINSQVADIKTDDFDGTAAVGGWSVGQSTLANDEDFGQQFLYKALLTVNFAGFENTVEVPTDENFLATQYDINNAIKDAIASDRDLQDLLVAEDGTGSQLNIASQVDGNNELAIDLSQREVVDDGDVTDQTAEVALDTGDLTAIQEGLGDSEVTDAAGVEGETLDTSASANGEIVTSGNGGSANTETVQNNSVINVGAGNDVVTLSSHADSENTIVLEGGGFGDNTIVNFFNQGLTAETGGTVGTHQLDFTAYLNTMNSPGDSDSTQSQELEPAAWTTASTVNVNEIATLDFDSAKNSDQVFSDLNGSTLRDALNDGDAFGGIDNGTLNAGQSVTNQSSMAGNTANHMVLVENDQNQGEYKVFHLQSDASASDATAFSSAQLVGQLDFGTSLEVDGTGDPALA